MKKLLFAAAALVSISGLNAKTVDECVNLTPYFDFNKQTEPIKFSVGVPNGTFNMPLDWYNSNVMAEGSAIDASNGILSLLGGPHNGFLEAVREEVNKSVHLVNLGGTAGTVWVLDYKGSDFRTACGYEARMEDRQSTQNVNNFVMEFIPFHESFAGYDGKELRCRIEFCGYRKAGSAKANTEFFKARMMNFDNGVKSTHKAEQGITAESFLNEANEFDATKWAVYDFPFTASTNTKYLQNLKIEMGNGTLLDATLLIRSIKFYDPTDVTDIPESVVTYKTYTAGAIIPVPLPEDEHKLYMTQEEFRDNMTVTFPVPANHNLYYKVEHNPACNHPSHNALSRTGVPEGYTLVDGDSYVYHAPAAGHSEILTLMSEDKSTGEQVEISHNFASNAVTGIETVGVDCESVPAELYNLQGIRVDAATAATGVYIERRGSAARKVAL